MKIKEDIAKMHVQYEQITDYTTRQNFATFFNIVEFLNTENSEQQKLIQALKDENNKLKGEQGKRSSRQGRNPVGESPTATITRFSRVAMPHSLIGNYNEYAWCIRPGRLV